MLRESMCAVLLGLFAVIVQMPWSAGAETFTGKVVEVIEGDIVRFTHDDKTETIRLHGVDCPEMNQPFGPEAKKFTSDLALGVEIRVEVTGVEPKNRQRAENRLVAEATLPEGTTLTQELLLAGMGWWNRQDTPQDPRLGSLCAKAIVTKKGLWADPAPLAPWDFRAIQEKEAAEAAKETDAPKQAPPKESTPRPKSGEIVFVAKNGSEYHHTGCVRLDRTKRAIARSRAEELGYGPCLLCFPRSLSEEAPKLAQKGNLEYVPPLELSEFRDQPLYNQLQPEWHRNAKGKVDGIAVQNLSSIPLAGALGFRDGDVLLSVNGETIDSEARIRQLYGKYKNTKNFKIDILRDGRPTTLDITIPF